MPNTNIATAISEPSVVSSIVYPLLVIGGTFSMLAYIRWMNDPTLRPVRTTATEATVAPKATKPKTLSDLMRELGHTWNDASNSGTIQYSTAPKTKELANLKEYLGKPMALRLIHTAKLPATAQELLLFSSTPISKGTKDVFDCHICLPLLSAMVVTKTPDIGLSIAVPLQPLMFTGSWGKIRTDGDATPEVLNLGPNTQGFAVKDKDGNQGEYQTDATIYAIQANQFKMVGEYVSELDTLGSYSCDQRHTKDVCKSSSTTWAFNPNDLNNGYYDVLSTTRTTLQENGINEQTTITTRLKFNGTHYAPIDSHTETATKEARPTSVQAPPKAPILEAATKPSPANSNGELERQLVQIVKRQLKAGTTLTKFEHSEFWKLMNQLTAFEKASFRNLTKVNLEGAIKHQLALIESAVISAKNGKVVRTEELIESTAETRKVFLTTLPTTLSPMQREEAVREYEARRLVADKNNDEFLRSAAAGRPHKASADQFIATDVESLRNYSAPIQQSIVRLDRLLNPVWKDEVKANQ